MNANAELIPLKAWIERLGVTYGVLYNAIQRGELKAIQFNPRGTLYIREEAIQGWLDSKTIN